MNLDVSTKIEISEAGRVGIVLMLAASLAGPVSTAMLIGSLTRYGGTADGAFLAAICSPCVFVIGALLVYFGRRFEHTIIRADD